MSGSNEKANQAVRAAFGLRPKLKRKATTTDVLRAALGLDPEPDLDQRSLPADLRPTTTDDDADGEAEAPKIGTPDAKAGTGRDSRHRPDPTASELLRMMR